MNEPAGDAQAVHPGGSRGVDAGPEDSRPHSSHGPSLGHFLGDGYRVGASGPGAVTKHFGSESTDGTGRGKYGRLCGLGDGVWVGGDTRSWIVVQAGSGSGPAWTERVLGTLSEQSLAVVDPADVLLVVTKDRVDDIKLLLDAVR